MVAAGLAAALPVRRGPDPAASGSTPRPTPGRRRPRCGAASRAAGARAGPGRRGRPGRIPAWTRCPPSRTTRSRSASAAAAGGLDAARRRASRPPTCSVSGPATAAQRLLAWTRSPSPRVTARLAARDRRRRGRQPPTDGGLPAAAEPAPRPARRGPRRTEGPASSPPDPPGDTCRLTTTSTTTYRRTRAPARGGPLRVGLGGPVGSGKTALAAALCRHARRRVRPRRRHQRHLHDRGRRLPAPQRRARPTTGSRRCRPAAARTPRSATTSPPTSTPSSCWRRGTRALDLVLVESGGDNLTATFSYGLVDVQVFVVDVAGGDKVPRKGGPGVTAADLLVVNKTDLAPLVGADLGVMRRDADAVRGRQADAADLAARGPGRRRRWPSGCASRCGPGRCRTREDASVEVVARRRTRRPHGAAGASARAGSSPSGGPGRRRCTWSPRRSGRSAATTRRIRLVVEEGARLRVRSVAAAVALPARGEPPPSRQRITRRGGRRRWTCALEPTVVAAARRTTSPSSHVAARPTTPCLDRHRAGAARPRRARSRAAGPARRGSSGPAARCCTPPSGSGPGEPAWLPPVAPRAYASTVHIGRGRRSVLTGRGRRPAAAARRLGDDGLGRPSCTGWCAAADALTPGVDVRVTA